MGIAEGVGGAEGGMGGAAAVSEGGGGAGSPGVFVAAVDVGTTTLRCIIYDK